MLTFREMALDLISGFSGAIVDFLAPLDEVANNPTVLQAWLAQLGHTAAISGLLNSPKSSPMPQPFDQRSPV